MRITKLIKGKNSNRRVALRVYERVNLFYKKMTLDSPHDTQPPLDNILSSFALPQSAGRLSHEPPFPFSQSQENDTLNVNISASGLAFTCVDELKAGEHLVLRILFLSNMTVMTTCCKVVYCKPSNPYEYNRHPYSIGAQFVNMTEQDQALLNKHVSKIRKQQLVVNGGIIAILLAFLAAPLEAMGLMVEAAHHLFEIVLHLLHLIFEFLEMGLDHIIEHHFHTDTHKTQIIVFYVLASFGLVALYFLCRKVISAIYRTIPRLLLFWSRKKSSVLYFWNQQNAIDKLKVVGIGTTAVVGYLYLFI